MRNIPSDNSLPHPHGSRPSSPASKNKHEEAPLHSYKRNGPGDRFKFVLYVAGKSPNSVAAEANLRALCAQHLGEGHEVEIIDVLQNPERALADKVLVTPMLVKTHPAPAARIAGRLHPWQALWVVLGLSGTSRDLA